MSIVLAKNSGFCYGVKRAVDMAIKAKEDFNKKIYTLGPIIHNNDVVTLLKGKNIFPIEIDEIDNLAEDDVVIIRSHGISLDILNKLKNKKVNIIDATCTYVSSIQKKVQKYYSEGYAILIVGDRSHPEVVGINGWCNNSAIISRDGSDLKDLPKKICVVSQTTEKEDHWENVLGKVIKDCKEILAFNTICSATAVRQKAAEELSKQTEVMIIIGGKNSSNTTKLFEICKRNCANTIHVENAGEIPDYITNKKDCIIGVTAGASTPDWIIREAVSKMSEDKNFEPNEQLEYMKKNDTQISIGQIVEGEVTSVNTSNKEAFVNIGYKSDALLPLSEITKEDNAEMENLIKKGEKVKGKIISLGSEMRPPIISIVELSREDALKEVREAFQNGTILNVKIKETVTGGLVSLYKGIVRLFIPASHIELKHVEDLTEYIGKNFEVNVIELDESKNRTRIVASRREILKEEKKIQEEETWSNLEKDTVVEGEVKRLTDFGAFVQIGEVDGLLHVSEMSWGRVSKSSDVLKIGDKIKVYILDIDKENKKLSLSLKKLQENPWNNVDIKYPLGSIVLGKVVRFSSFGAFVELEPGVDGLVHISQISHKRIEKAEDALKIGENIKAKIVNVDKENKKIGLSIKEVNDI
ncbi:bifunctional 4-hydroxy-3-methylbut-2-enyl diphosphate reductase/30S ribosomal protein S1 [Clostridium lundense]|uniref:bifunctional 4-hydroxy-3-methylbut-2-enyl diphosphate reductase/30S ribosomal protein S1 n=1 Tax=Clostridium lundense TaxID=319475 RepID=UPI00047F2E46|nr:bifunctional 4-hydroxy-3-methylbut-2-enyl diphosphate reductase/30S ribosomal protein S1 [Clostridium lundense]